LGRYDYPFPANQGVTREFLYPALALPTTGKAGFECPDAHLTELRDSVARMRALLVVGWRGQEEHFLSILSEVSHRVAGHVVSGSAEGAATVAALLASRVTGLDIRSSTSFSDFVLDPAALSRTRP
jgi:hypothetical protein